ncbi:MAG: hypothetical protein ACO22A_06700, partial [Schleiferiaceae bacterium]
HTTRQSWETSLGSPATEPDIADLLGEEFTGALLMGGRSTTSANYTEERGKSTVRHDGRTNAVSAAGNARINHAGAAVTTEIADDHCRHSWLESIGPGNNGFENVYIQAIASGGQVYVHHNILGNNDASTSAAQHGVRCNATNGAICVFFNIVYGHGGNGIQSQTGGASSVFYNNTVYRCNRSNTGGGVRGGIRSTDTDWTVYNNAAMENLQADFLETGGTFDYNASDDATGDDEGSNGLINRTPADEFVSPTSTYTALDLLLLSTSTLIGEGTDISGSGLPDITLDIKGDTITAPYPIGAAYYVAAGGATTRGTPFGHRGTAFNGGRTFHGIIQ